MVPQISEKEFIFELDGFTAQLCTTPESKQIAYNLRHRCYLDSGRIKACAEQELTDNYDKEDNARTHLLWYNDMPVATVRSAIWSPNYQWKPTEGVQEFWHDIHKSIGLENVIIESNRFAIDPIFQGRRSFKIQLLLFRIQDLNALYEGCNNIITVVRENHVAFYKRMLGFKQISDKKYYPWLDSNVVLLSSSAQDSRDLITARGMSTCSARTLRRYKNICQNIK